MRTSICWPSVAPTCASRTQCLLSEVRRRRRLCGGAHAGVHTPPAAARVNVGCIRAYSATGAAPIELVRWGVRRRRGDSPRRARTQVNVSCVCVVVVAVVVWGQAARDDFPFAHKDKVRLPCCTRGKGGADPAPWGGRVQVLTMLVVGDPPVLLSGSMDGGGARRGRAHPRCCVYSRCVWRAVRPQSL